MLGRLWAPLGVIVFLIAIAGAFGVVRWAGRYWFHMLRAAHTAVLTEFIVTGKGPEQGQLAYGKAQVLARFKDTSILFAGLAYGHIDQIVTAGNFAPGNAGTLLILTIIKPLLLIGLLIAARREQREFSSSSVAQSAS